jgi:uncharacterized membrane protein YkoI
MKYLLALPLLLAAFIGPALARDSDHDRARQAVRSGEALPLRTILDKAAAEFPGELIEAELEDEHGRLIYEIKLITPDGNVLKVYYDARDGSVLKTKGRGKKQ